MKAKFGNSKQNHQKQPRYQAWSFGMAEKFVSRNRENNKSVFVKTFNMSIQTKFDIQDLYITHYTDRLEPSPLNRNIYYTNRLRKGIPAQHPEWPYILQDSQNNSELIMPKDVFQICFLVHQKGTDTDKQYRNYQKKGIQIIFKLQKKSLESQVSNITSGIAISLDKFDEKQKTVEGKIIFIQQDRVQHKSVSFFSTTQSVQFRQKDNKSGRQLMFLAKQRRLKNQQQNKSQQKPVLDIVSKNGENILESINQIHQYFKFIAGVQSNSSQFFISFFKEDQIQQGIFAYGKKLQHQRQNRQLKQIFGYRHKYIGEKQQYKNISNIKNLPQSYQKLHNLLNIQEYQILQDFYFEDQEQQITGQQQRHGFVMQGQTLGNCYMISTLVSLGCFASEYIRDAIICQSYLPNISIVNLNIDGKRISLLVPTIVPHDLSARQTIYSKINRQIEDYPNSGQAKRIARYSIYIELAIAMVYRYYEHLVAGQSEEVFMMLTNNSSKKYFLNQEKDRDQFKKILHRSKNDHNNPYRTLITLGIGTLINKKTKQSLKGMQKYVEMLSKCIQPKNFEQHQFAFLDCKQLYDHQDKKERLFIKLYNPQQNGGADFFKNWNNYNQNSTFLPSFRNKKHEEYFRQWNEYQKSKYNTESKFTANQFIIDFQWLVNLKFTATVCLVNPKEKHKQNRILMVQDHYTEIEFTPKQKGQYRIHFIQPSIRHTLEKSIKIDVKSEQRKNNVKKILNNYTNLSVNMILKNLDSEQKMQILNDGSKNMYTTLSSMLEAKKYAIKVGQYSLQNMSPVFLTDKYKKNVERIEVTESQNRIFFENSQFILDGRITNLKTRFCYLSIIGIHASTVGIYRIQPKTAKMVNITKREITNIQQIQKISFHKDQTQKVQIWHFNVSGKFLVFKYKRFTEQKKNFLEFQIQQTDDEKFLNNKAREQQLTTNEEEAYFLYSFSHSFQRLRRYKISILRRKQFNELDLPTLTAQIFNDEDQFRKICYSNRRQAQQIKGQTGNL